MKKINKKEIKERKATTHITQILYYYCCKLRHEHLGKTKNDQRPPIV